MPKETFDLELLDEAGNRISASVRTHYRSWTESGFLRTEVQLELHWPGNCVLGTDWHYFAALCRVREQLSEIGLTPRCFGACRNLVLTGMCVDWFEGESGYLTRLGEPLTARNLVNIFDCGPEMDLVSVAEQAAYKKEWRKSVSMGR